MHVIDEVQQRVKGLGDREYDYKANAPGKGAEVPASWVAWKALRGMVKRGELYPGSAEKIWPHVGRRSSDPTVTLRHLEQFLEGPGRRYVNPEYQPGDEPQGPLRVALRRFGATKDDADAWVRKYGSEVDATESPLNAARTVLIREDRATLLGYDGGPPVELYAVATLSTSPEEVKGHVQEVAGGTF